MATNSKEDLTLYEALSDQIIDKPPMLRYIPIGALETLVCRERVRASLEKHFRPEEELVTFILVHAKWCFATLVFTNMEQHIEQFRQCGFTDAFLPIRFVTQGRNCSVHIVDKIANDAETNTIKKCFSTSWDRRACENFFETQWLFHAPIFTEENLRHEFHEKRPLPFISPNSDPTSRTTLFSDVKQLLIHRDHIKGVCHLKSALFLEANR